MRLSLEQTYRQAEGLEVVQERVLAHKKQDPFVALLLATLDEEPRGLRSKMVYDRVDDFNSRRVRWLDVEVHHDEVSEGGGFLSFHPVAEEGVVANADDEVLYADVLQAAESLLEVPLEH